jgi:hypothetical protein
MFRVVILHPVIDPRERGSARRGFFAFDGALGLMNCSIAIAKIHSCTQLARPLVQ